MIKDAIPPTPNLHGSHDGKPCDLRWEMSSAMPVYSWRCFSCHHWIGDKPCKGNRRAALAVAAPDEPLPNRRKAGPWGEYPENERVENAPPPAAAQESAHFKREFRYVVLKLKDTDRYLSADQNRQLGELMDCVEKGRIREGKERLKAVIVESDWPEYEPTWKAIEQRMSGDSPPSAQAMPEEPKPVAWIWHYRDTETKSLRWLPDQRDLKNGDVPWTTTPLCKLEDVRTYATSLAAEVARLKEDAVCARTQYSDCLLRLESAESSLAAAEKDARRWRMLPAFEETYQIDYVHLLRDIDAALGASHEQ